MRNTNTPVALEGIPFILVGVLLTSILFLFHWLPAAVALVLTLFVIYFFRNPRRTIPEDENAVVAPADGVIIYLGEASEEHLGTVTTKISIFMSVFNVHINRVPISGTVLDTFYTRGKFLDVRHERATFENEQKGLIIETAKGWRVAVVQVAGLIARRIVCYANKRDWLQRGERYGLIRFGSRLDIYLPPETTVRVSLGEKTVAGETILGILP